MRREYIDFQHNVPIEIAYRSIKEYPIHWHSNMEIIYVIRGKIEVTIETETHSISQGEIEIINSDEAHSIYSEDYDNRVLIFSIDTNFFNKYYDIENIFFYTGSSGKNVQKTEKYEKLRRYLSILLWESANKKSGYKDIIEDKLIELLYHLVNKFHYLIYEEEGLKENEIQFERYDRIIKYIYSNYNNKISLQDIARREYLSSHYLSNGIKNNVGYSFNDFLNLTRVEEAIKYLLDTDKTISEISEELGFSHTRYFNKHFKRHYNCTPMQYRKKHRASNKKYEEMKKYQNFRVEESFEEISSYLENYPRFKSEDKIIKLNIDPGNIPKERLSNPLGECIHTGSYRNLLIGWKREILKNTQRDFEFKYAIIDSIFSNEIDETLFQEVVDAVRFLISIEITPKIIVQSGCEIHFSKVESFIDYFKNFNGEYEIGKWHFCIYDDLDEKYKNEVIKSFKDKFNMELHEISCPLEDNTIGNIIDITRGLDSGREYYINLFDEKNSKNILSGNGFYNSLGIKKHLYHSCYFIKKLGKNIISMGEGYMVTEEDDNYQILLHAYEEKKTSTDNFADKRSFSINISALPYDYRVISLRTNEKTDSFYEILSSTSNSKHLTDEERKLLEISTAPTINIGFAGKSPVFNIVSELEGSSANLIILQKVQKHP